MATPTPDVGAVELHEASLPNRMSSHHPNPQRQGNLGGQPLELIALADNPPVLHRARTKRAVGNGSRLAKRRLSKWCSGRRCCTREASADRGSATGTGLQTLQMNHRRHDAGMAAPAIDLAAGLLGFDMNRMTTLLAHEEIGRHRLTRLGAREHGGRLTGEVTTPRYYALAQLSQFPRPAIQQLVTARPRVAVRLAEMDDVPGKCLKVCCVTRRGARTSEASWQTMFPPRAWSGQYLHGG